MKNLIKAASLALALVAAPMAAQAAERVVFDFGNVAFGYSDGYWDRDHHWHRWHHKSDWQRYRHDYRDHAYDYRHDRDHDHGWRDPYWH